HIAGNGGASDGGGGGGGVTAAAAPADGVPPFDSSATACRDDLSFHNGGRTLSSVTGTNTMAVVSGGGFGRCKAVWSFRLDVDKEGDECVAFGASTLPATKLSYDDGTMP